MGLDIGIGLLTLIMFGSLLVLLMAGGIAYTVGTIFHHSNRIPYARAIWHTHVLAAAASHYAAIILVIR